MDALKEIGAARGVSAAQVALAWLLGRPGVSSLVIGGRNAAQFRDSLAAAELGLAPEERARLDAVSAPPVIYPYWHQHLDRRAAGFGPADRVLDARGRAPTPLASRVGRDHMPRPAKETAMQTRNKILDDLAQLMSNAMGVAQGAKVEAETAMKGLVDRWLADRNFVTREEFDAVRAMAQKAREENEALKARLAALEWRKGRRRRVDGSR